MYRRPPQRRSLRRLHCLSPLLGATLHRKHRRIRNRAHQRPPLPLRWNLQRNGHGEYHGLPRRGPRPQPQPSDVRNRAPTDADRPPHRRARRQMAISGGPKLRNLITNASVRNAMIMLQAVGRSTSSPSPRAVWRLLAEYNQFCHRVQRNAATECKVSSTPKACRAAVAVRSGRCPIRAQGSKVRFADHPELGGDLCESR
jgi:hypothetical protein